MTAKKSAPKKRAPLSSTAQFERLLKKASGDERYELQLYVAGNTPRSTQAITNIRSLCEEYLEGHFDLVVVDIYQQPAEAAGEQIIAAPTLIKKLPEPARRLVGDLADRDKVILGLNLRRPEPASPKKPRKTKWLAL